MVTFFGNDLSLMVRSLKVTCGVFPNMDGTECGTAFDSDEAPAGGKNAGMVERGGAAVLLAGTGAGGTAGAAVEGASADAGGVVVVGTFVVLGNGCDCGATVGGALEAAGVGNDDDAGVGGGAATGGGTDTGGGAKVTAG